MKSILDPLLRYTTQHLYSGTKRKALANWNSEAVQAPHEREAEQGGEYIEHANYYTVEQSANRRGQQLLAWEQARDR
jgi:hypothetical protein